MSRRQSRRAWLTGGVSVALALTIVLLRSYPAIVAIAAFGLVAVSSRSSLPWADRLPFGSLIRRLTRSLVFFAPLLTFGIPELHVSGLALLAAIGPTVLAMAFGWANIRLGLSSRMVEMLGPLGSMDRARDLIYFFSGGAAQEYLYRWVVFVAFTPLLDWVVIPLSVLLFVGEHVLHAVARSTWDARDVVVHAVLGTVYAAVMYLTGSWLAVAIAHTVYNLPNVVQTLLRPSIPKRQPVPVA